MPLNNCQQDFKESIHLLMENQFQMNSLFKVNLGDLFKRNEMRGFNFGGQQCSAVNCVLCMSSLFHEYKDWKNVVEIVTVELLICSCGDAISMVSQTAAAFFFEAKVPQGQNKQGQPGNAGGQYIKSMTSPTPAIFQLNFDG